ncbi:Scavenger receptor cysteine-rich domain superfamily protein, partial [Geodia barretti]
PRVLRADDCFTGEVRLVGGESEREGRVEVCSDGKWGTVCGRQWTDKNTAVVCSYLGFSDHSNDLAYHTSAKYGRGGGPVLMDYVSCTGSEGRLWDSCTHFTHYYGCTHDDDVGIECQPARCSDGQLRITDFNTDFYGRVEICSNQRFETFSYYHWSIENAEVACRELGYNPSYGYNNIYENGGGPRHSKLIECSGSEDRLSECEISNMETLSKTMWPDVGIYCSPVYCANGAISLMEGVGEWEGRLEVCYVGRWGTVSADEWTETNSRVVCNSLGYEISEEPPNPSIPMAPSRPQYFHSVKCSNQTLSLVECGFTRNTLSTDNHSQVTVKCKRPRCKDGDLKLVGGATESEGRLEVCFGKRWGTIDGHGWTHTDTQVACRQLGHSTEDVSFTTKVRNRAGTSKSLPTFMTLVGCYSSEDKLTDCSYHEFEWYGDVISTLDISISCDNITAAVDSTATVDSTEDTGGTKSPIIIIDNDSENSTQSSATADSQIHTDDKGSSKSDSGESGLVYASLIISVLLAIALVASLIVIFVLRRRKKSIQSSYGITFSSNTESVALENKMVGEDYEAPNPLPKGATSAAAEPQSHSDGQSTCLDETEASPTSNSTEAIYECAN